MEALSDSMEELQSTLAGWYDAATAGPSAKHAGFYAPLITGRVCGVGCHLGLVNPPSGKTNVVVVATEPNTAAARAGLQSGDVVVSVNGRPIQGRLYIPDDVAALIRGREGTTVEIVIERSGGERVKHVLVRELLDVEAADVAEDAGNSLYLTEAAPSTGSGERPAKKGVPVTP